MGTVRIHSHYLTTHLGLLHFNYLQGYIDGFELSILPIRAEIMKQIYTHTISEFDIHTAIVELVKEGIMLLSQNLQLIYSNKKAKEICQQLQENNYVADKLPPIISKLLHRLSQNLSSEHETFVMDYQLNEERMIRIRACFPDLNDKSELMRGDRPWVLLFLEDRNSMLQEELRIEQKKYNLSDRELEVLSLLSKSLSYQEIANRLQVSLNTVKFHVKNINQKKQSHAKQEIILKVDN